MKRLPIVGVMGSGTEPHTEKATRLGMWLASEPVHLLTGGGAGVMGAVSQAFYNTQPREGLVLGILPAGDAPTQPKPGYPNRWVELPIYTHLPLSGNQGQDVLSRNHINILSSAVIIALPGGAGTASEAALAIRYRHPIAAYLTSRDDIPGLPADVPVYDAFADITTFIRSQLNAWSEPMP